MNMKKGSKVKKKKRIVIKKEKIIKRKFTFLLILWIIALFIVGLVIAGYILKKPEQKTGCTENTECFRAGCSGQVCTTKDQANKLKTTCEWKEEYSCYRNQVCGCVNNKCQWVNEEEIDSCLKKYKK